MRALRTSAFALSVVSLVACEGGRAPFALFGNDHLRPGIRMAKLQKATDAESRHAFRCRPLWAGAQQCVMPVSPGDLHAVVDSAGRVIRLTLVAPVTDERQRALAEAVTNVKMVERGGSFYLRVH